MRKGRGRSNDTRASSTDSEVSARQQGCDRKILHSSILRQNAKIVRPENYVLIKLCQLQIYWNGNHTVLQHRSEYLLILSKLKKNYGKFRSWEYVLLKNLDHIYAANPSTYTEKLVQLNLQGVVISYILDSGVCRQLPITYTYIITRRI